MLTSIHFKLKPCVSSLFDAFPLNIAITHIPMHIHTRTFVCVANLPTKVDLISNLTFGHFKIRELSVSANSLTVFSKSRVPL